MSQMQTNKQIKQESKAAVAKATQYQKSVPVTTIRNNGSRKTTQSK